MCLYYIKLLYPISDSLYTCISIINYQESFPYKYFWLHLSTLPKQPPSLVTTFIAFPFPNQRFCDPRRFCDTAHGRPGARRHRPGRYWLDLHFTITVWRGPAAVWSLSSLPSTLQFSCHLLWLSDFYFSIPVSKNHIPCFVVSSPATKMSIFVKESHWTESANKVCINLPLRGKQRRDVDILQTQTYTKASKLPRSQHYYSHQPSGF